MRTTADLTAPYAGSIPAPNDAVKAAVFETVLDCLVAMDAEGKIFEFNPAAETTFGYSRDEAMSRNIEDLVVPPAHATSGAGGLSRYLAGSETSTRGRGPQIQAMRADGTTFPIEIGVTEMRFAGRPYFTAVIRDVSEERVAAGHLRESQRLLAATQTASHIGSFELDLQTGAMAWSDELYRVFGYEPRSLRIDYSTFLECIHPDDRARAEVGLTDGTDDGRFAMECRALRPDGTVRWIHAWGEFSPDEGGSTSLLASVQDVSERRAAEIEHTSLRERQEDLAEEFRLLLESAGEGIFGLDHYGTCTFVNRTAAELLCRDTAELLGEGLHALTHHTTSEGLPFVPEKCAINRAFRTGEAAVVEGEVFWRPDGSSFPVEYSVNPILKLGKPAGAVVAFRDISRRIEMERDLRASANLFQGAFAAAQTGIALIGADSRTYVDVNPALCEMLGYSKDELLALNWVAVTHPDDREVNLELVDRFLSGHERTDSVRKRYIRKDGQVILVDISEAIIRGAEGRPLYLVSHVTDVTERERATSALKKSQELLQAVVYNSPAIIYIKESNGKYLVANDGFLDVAGRPRDEVIGRTDHEIFPQEFADILVANDREMLEKGSLRLEERVPHADGTIHTYISAKFPLTAERQNAEVCGISTDITDRVEALDERRRLEAQLRQAHKMEAVGRLAGGVAHDFNNILSVILNYAQFVIDDMEDDDIRRADLREIITAGESAAQLVHHLLAFSRKEIIEPRVLDLNDVLSGLHGLLRRSIGEDVRLEIHFDPDLWLTKSDPSQLEQILMNLVVNARDAMPEGGELRLGTGNELIEDGARDSLPGGRYVVLTVTDDGDGMDAATTERIFEPFFTTKARGKGTGLGLATVYGIVKQAGGGIYVDSEIDRGTSFSVYLPATEEPATPADADAAPEDDVAETGTILVVEDEDLVRNLVSRILTGAGFGIVAVSSGQAAVSYCAEHPDEIDLLLTDVIMPEMSGKTLADTLTRSSNVGVVYMSGYTDEIIAKRGVLDGGETLIEKPFTARDLVTKVRSALKDHRSNP